MSADKAYSGRENLLYIDSIGGTAFIPFKSSTTGNSKGSFIWSKMYYYFALNNDEFMLHYHKRSNIESVFASIKRKLWGTLKSKNDTAQKN